MKKLFNVAAVKAPVARINYSISCYKQKIFLFAGMDMENNLLNSMDEFEASLYKYQPVKYRGEYFPKARHGHTAVAIDQYTMLIIGGT